ncbi:PIG-L deacetylase family protein [Streptomyces sp. NPDC091272]|uniref:PIG-L deacetylase family protein n=1 Tax=Streptomyces sp. NPDC091272 TaxID=3365981 RepID=UPI0037FE47B4
MATLVAFFAHPDDEVLHAGGTLARAAAEGHRVVVVSATDGEMGPVPHEASRLDELRASAEALGAARVACLGFADSGHGRDLYPDPPGRQRFVRASREEAAERLAAVLREERADLLLTHDAAGGYGHRDHVRAHQMGLAAAELAGVRRVLIAAITRTAPIGLLRLLPALMSLAASPLSRPFARGALRAQSTRVARTRRAEITHSVDVRAYADRKQAALASHRSQVWGEGHSAAVFRALVRMPSGTFGMLLGRERFVEVRTARGPARGERA